MTQTIVFNKTSYTESGLTAMSVVDLLTLRNVVAESLGVAASKGFKDAASGAAQTWKALLRFDSNTVGADEKPAKAKAAAKPKKERKPRGIPKSAEAKTVKRPNQKMFSTIKKVGEHDGTQGRQDRWPNYKDGMTLVDIIETAGTEPWDVYNWESQGLIKFTLPTDEEFVVAKAAWYKRHGLTDPALAKEQKAAERAEAKVKRDAEKAAKADA